MPRFSRNKQDKSSLLASIRLDFDYSADTGFVMPPSPCVPDGGKLYDAANIDFSSYKDGFSVLVGKMWGKSISGLDTAKKGGFALQGRWTKGDCVLRSRQGADLGTRYKMGEGLSVFLTSYEGKFYDLPETLALNTPVVFSGNLGSLRWCIVLMPKPLLSSMERRNSFYLRDWFGSQWREKGELEIGRVAIPFPFNTVGAYLKDFKVFNYPEAKLSFELGADWTMVYSIVFDSFGRTLVECPEVNGSFPLMFGMNAEQMNVNVLSVAVQLMQSGNEQGLWDFSSLLLDDGVESNHDSVRNRQSLLKFFNGDSIQENVVLDQPPPLTIQPPLGLTELPVAPKGYGYICDLSGVVYMTDKHRKSVFFPSQVFDLRAMYAELEKVDEDDFSSGFYDLKNQIKLVEDLFHHQEKVLKGTLFNYEMGRRK